jgi:hypothetical protein
MRGMIRMVKKLFTQKNSYSSIFSAAIREGIKETLEEMGYRVEKDHEKS